MAEKADLVFTMNPHAGQQSAVRQASQEAIGPLLNSAELKWYKAGDTIIENGFAAHDAFQLGPREGVSSKCSG